MSKSGVRKRIREIEVTGHAVERWRERARDYESSPLEVRAQIERLVREGLTEGFFRTHKPDAFLRYRERRVQLLADERFIATPDMRWGFLGRIEGRTFVVRTVVTPTQVASS